MERKAQISEIIIKLLFAISSIIAIIFIIINLINMIPLLGNMADENAIYKQIAKTHFGVIYSNLTSYHGKFSFYFAIKALVVFIFKMEWICYVFLILDIGLLIVNFVLVKWKLISNYVLLSSIVSLLYIIKYIVFGIAFSTMLFNEFSKAIISIKFATISYIIFSVFEVFILGMFIVKFILNLPMDIKYLLSNESL